MNSQALHDAQSRQNKAKLLRRKKSRDRFMASIKRVSHLSRRAKRRWHCKLQLWMWRMRREKCHFWLFRNKRRKKQVCLIGSSPNLKTQSQKGEVQEHHPPNLEHLQRRKLPLVSPLGCDAEGASEERCSKQNCLKLSKLSDLSGMGFAAKLMQKQVAIGTITQDMPSQRHGEKTMAQFCGHANSSEFCHAAKPLQDQSTDSNGQSTRRDTAERNTKRKAVSSQSLLHQTDVSHETLTKDIHEFLDDFYRIYGSFIPLEKSNVLSHLKRKSTIDLNDRKHLIFSEVTEYQSAVVRKPIPSFQVVYKRHTLTLDDLSTLADQNWLNDQVMNMYGELIVESANHTVHFLNSFFHRQLVTKGYEGVKRWTKKVDLFSKSLLLVPIHLEVHWCLVIADMVKKQICLYDSQGNRLQKVVRNILKYLMTEAKERQQTAFENGWSVSFDATVPQQKNENDCGVFVLEYSRCLALAKPLHFSQNNIPKIRKRIYKELCDCQLHE
ncbi:hypothetical protein LDENG_00263620 [Lucifuga dentata]|nr:hypothetical protein LDENG_00263620 [Lucifuga dentata]